MSSPQPATINPASLNDINTHVSAPSLSTSSKFLFAQDTTDDDGISDYLLERRKFYQNDTWEKLRQALMRTSTLYIGNLSFYTTEEQLYSLFSQCGPIRHVIMGLNRQTLTPCGFAFIIFHNHYNALSAQRFIHNSILCDERAIKVSLDPGYEKDREYGRSKTGGQRRDDRIFDPNRTGAMNLLFNNNFKKIDLKEIREKRDQKDGNSNINGHLREFRNRDDFEEERAHKKKAILKIERKFR